MELTEIVHSARGTDILDTDNERNIETALRYDNKLLKRFKELKPHLLEPLTEEEFAVEFGHDKNFAVLRRLRHQVWNEFNNYMDNPKHPGLTADRIYSGIVPNYTWRRLLEDDLYVTYLLTQPQNVQLIQQDLLYESYKQIEEIMSLPNVDGNNKPDHRLIKAKMDIIKNLQDRVNGAVVQRTQTYNENVTKGDDNQGKSLEDLRDEISKLKKEMNYVEVLPGE